MEITLLLSNRKYEHRVFWDLVREWEDSLSKYMNIPIYCIFSESYCYSVFRHKFVRRMIRKLPFLKFFYVPCGYKLIFEMQPELPAPESYEEFGIHFDIDKTIPWIIDCIFTENDFVNFNEAYRKYPLVLISSMKSYNILKNRNLCPDVNIVHCALSISDKYKMIDSEAMDEKQYDVVLAGRQEPVLLEYLEKYNYSHPGLIVVSRKQKGEKWEYQTSDGSSLGNMESRDDFINLLRKTRIGFYSTPHTHPQYAQTQDFVTPRILEYMACGCHVIAKYPINDDVNYWRLPEIIPSIDTYEQFEMAMDYSLSNKIDSTKYEKFLSMHYTSVRAKQLQKIVSEL